MGAIITITINGTQTTASSTDSILDIINQYKLNPSSVIVELNEHIIKKMTMKQPNSMKMTALNSFDTLVAVRVKITNQQSVKLLNKLSKINTFEIYV